MHFHAGPSPVTMAGFGGLIPPNKISSHPKSLQYLSNFRMSKPCTSIKPPWWRLSGDGSSVTVLPPSKILSSRRSDYLYVNSSFDSNSNHIFCEPNNHNPLSGHRDYLYHFEVVIFQAIQNSVLILYARAGQICSVDEPRIVKLKLQRATTKVSKHKFICNLRFCDAIIHNSFWNNLQK